EQYQSGTIPLNETALVTGMEQSVGERSEIYFSIHENNGKHSPSVSVNNQPSLEECQNYGGYIVYEARATDAITSVLNYTERNCFIRTSQCWEKYRQGFTLAVDDVEKTYALEECLLNFLRESQVRAKLAAPIIFEDKLWGLLIAHQCDNPHQWTESEKNLLIAIAEQLAIAIHQADLMQTLTQEKQTLEQRVIERTMALRDALLAAEAANRLRSEFLATISHELLTPLTYVIGMSSTLLRWPLGELSQRQRGYLQTIHDSGEHLLEMINDILDLSQIEAGKIALNISEFSLVNVAENAVESLRKKAISEQINLNLDLQIDPQARSLARSFSDSVLYSISLKSIHPERKTLLIDLGDLLLTDLGGLSASLGVPATTDQSYFGTAKAFPQNLEIESVLNFSGGGDRDSEVASFASLADNRGYTLRVHYSLSQLPDKDYRPRIADDRIGYFITAYQDLSKDDRGDSFVRYINRWDLEKQDPKAAISPPKKPIVFWIDNAVPLEYRNAIKEGVLMWNKAFLKAGFKDAIEVRQMPDDATWDPGDIRYNTIRWINTVDGYFAMGPSRVNPLTGEILDADILVDASFVRALKNEYRQIVQPSQTENRTTLSALMQNRLLCANGLDAKNNSVAQQVQRQQGLLSRLSKMAAEYDLCYGMEAANQFAFGSLAMSLLPDTMATPDQVKEYINQYLRLIIAHEVGHTLGLRHNFRGSTLLPPDEMNNTEITKNKGLTTSVMDYIPPNIAPQGTKQGDYFPSMVGPYDEWAIKYGYIPIQTSTPIAEKPILSEIAAQSYKPELSYSTDEDVYDLDPTADAWDNSGNVLLYSQWQLNNSRVMWERLDKRYPMAGDSYSDVSERFSTVLGNYFQQIYYTTKYIGGQSFYRIHPSEIPFGVSPQRLPFEPVPVEEQRQALETLQKYVFAEDALSFSPELLNKLAPSRWRHWGSSVQVGRLDFPIHDLVLFMQGSVLRDLLSGDRLSRLKDIELKTKPENAL
ncbi:zinc-dependent metalloprotease, partial [Nostoc sp. CHAB 5715]|uniref:zinc-dependent metalloprotease n=1 Tax=Nostoc sp. CHAB 5715 TaxID=2780400 RepID=UPI001E3F7A38